MRCFKRPKRKDHSDLCSLTSLEIFTSSISSIVFMCTKPSGVLDSLFIYVVFKDFHTLKGSLVKGSVSYSSGPVFSKHLWVMSTRWISKVSVSFRNAERKVCRSGEIKGFWAL